MQSKSLAILVGLSIHLESLSMVRGSGVKRSVLEVSLYEVAVNHSLVHTRLPQAQIIVSSDGVCKAPSNLALFRTQFFIFE